MMVESSALAQKIVRQVGALPSLPQVAWKVMRLTKDPDSTAQQLEALISRDQAMTAKVLMMSNTAFFGVRGRISTISHAIVVLGLKRLRSLVWALSIEGVFRSNTFKETLLWEHSLAAAFAAEEISALVDYESSEEAFVAALMHDIGKPVIDRHLGTHYQQVVEAVYNDGLTFLQAEQELLGFDHTEVGALLGQRWNLSENLCAAVAFHHRPGESEEATQLCAIVSLANDICVRLGIGPEKRPELEPAEGAGAQILSLEELQVRKIMESLPETLAKEKGFFQLS